jgi:hypothetical protein
MRPVVLDVVSSDELDTALVELVVDPESSAVGSVIVGDPSPPDADDESVLLVVVVDMSPCPGCGPQLASAIDHPTYHPRTRTSVARDISAPRAGDFGHEQYL